MRRYWRKWLGLIRERDPESQTSELNSHARSQLVTQQPTHSFGPGGCENAALDFPPFFTSTMTEYDDYGVPVGAYQEPDSFTGQTYRTARAFLLYRAKPFVEGRVAHGRWKRLFSLANALVVVWWVVVYWGERGAFNGAVGSCNWDAWENWVRRSVAILSTQLTLSRRKEPTLTDSSSSPTRNSSIRTHIPAGHGRSTRSP